MSAIFNIYNTVSSTYWYPVDFHSITEDYKFKKTPVVFSNGISFYLHNFFENAEDVSFNRRTGLILTNPKNNTFFLENNQPPSIQNKLTQIKTPTMLLSGVSSTRVIQSLPINNSINSLKTLNVSYRSTFGLDDTLSFSFNSNGTVTIYNNDNKALTWSSLGEGGLVFKDVISPPSIRQQFDYILNKDSIILFQHTSNYSNIVIKNTSTNNFILSAASFDKNYSFPNECIIKFISYDVYNPDENNTVLDSFIVKYKASPILPQQTLTVDNSINETNRLAQNYLAAFPVENPLINEKDSSYLLQFHGLKNYQTPEYTYTTANPYISSTQAIRRVYNKIHTGTNQNKGYNNIYLNYVATTNQLTFPVGKETYFFFPSTNVSYPLSSSGLIEDGATAGELPYVSDRIFVYRQNYEELTPGVPQPPSILKQDNTWLCSWLSGSNLGEKIWLDRYYNAAYYTLDQALTAKAMVYHDKIDPSKKYTYDVPSTMVLEPGILYKYYRAGIENSKEFITHLDYDPVYPLGAKVLDISDWSTSPLIDESKYNNNGVVVSNTNTQNLQKSFINLDGTNHVVFPSRSSLLQNQKITVSFWMNVENWSNIFGEQIFGNYYSSGFGLINESFTSAPMFTIINKASLSAYNINYNFLNLTQINLNPTKNNQYNIIQRLPDLSYWIFDSYNITGTKYNPINKVLSSFTSLSSYIGFVDQVELDSNQNLYLYDKTLNSYVKTDSDGNFIEHVTLPSDSGVHRIEIDLNDEVQHIYGTSSVIDNKNNIWEVVGGNLYKNRMIYANVGNTQQITCDSDNRIWISHLQDTISLLDTETNTFIFSKRVGKNSTLPIDPCLDQEVFRSMDLLKVPSSPTCNNSSIYQDRLILLDTRDNQMYIISTDGNLVSKLNLASLVSYNESLNFSANGDFTSFQYIRKFGGSLTKKLSWKLKLATPQGNSAQLLNLDADVSQLPPGWHNITLTFDAIKGIATYYIDSIEVNKKTFDPSLYVLYYDYRSSLLLGAASVVNTTLNDIIGIDDEYKFVGKISELKMYSKCLTFGEVEQLYFSSGFAYPRNDLLWNLSVGNRSYIEEI